MVSHVDNSAVVVRGMLRSRTAVIRIENLVWRASYYAQTRAPPVRVGDAQQDPLSRWMVPSSGGLDHLKRYSVGESRADIRF